MIVLRTTSGLSPVSMWFKCVAIMACMKLTPSETINLDVCASVSAPVRVSAPTRARRLGGGHSPVAVLRLGRADLLDGEDLQDGVDDGVCLLLVVHFPVARRGVSGGSLDVASRAVTHTMAPAES